ncbi:MAG: tRNA (N6-isopentenyl adenosine(37)-C2)-methylthiotransferase MiaB [Dehalococcoidia bacterium]|nr:tRNA (N6-isopentenyl adenosine(37)-C2)-methylthiotransferase MiaB [Dehalococcoidia bacterium]
MQTIALHPRTPPSAADLPAVAAGVLAAPSVFQQGAQSGAVPKRYYIWTVGCQMNKADSERLGNALDQLGLTPVEDAAEADVIVFNSCVVRQSAEDKVASALGTVKPLKRRRPEAVVALMGCMVGPQTRELQRRFPYVDVFMRPQQFKPLLDVVGERLGVDWEGCVGALAPTRPGVTAYIPIIHGCDLFCTFCIIPYRRGRQVSRPVDEVVREAEHLVARGVREVTLLGQTVDAYGADLPDRPDLADLLTALHPIQGLERIRFLTSHPNFMSDRIIGTVAELDKVCEHVNLPVQTGDDAVLTAMRRGYTRGDYLRLVDRIRARVLGVSLTTDVIVGFCGETDEQFRQTASLLEEVQFDKVHIARYSTRPGTIAARKLDDDVSDAVKDERLRVLEAIQTRIVTESNARLKGKAVQVLVEGRDDGGKWRGRTRSDKLAFIDDLTPDPFLDRKGVRARRADLTGETVSVEVTATSPWSLQGRLPNVSF